MKKKAFMNIEMGINIMLSLTVAIIIFSSIEALMLAKSKEIYDAYLMANPNFTSQDFINFVLIGFISNIFEPIVISLYSFFTYKKYRFNRIYKFVFCTIILIKMINIAFKFAVSSIFYFILLILYALLFMTIAYLPTKKNKN